MNSFFFWWSVVSTIIGIALLIFSVWQYLSGRSKEERLKAQVKVWMQDANGISTSLNRVVIDNLQKRFSTTNDVCNAVWAIQSSASALYQSLYEERCVTEEEYKERQKKIAARIEQQMNLSSASPTPSVTTQNPTPTGSSMTIP